MKVKTPYLDFYYKCMKTGRLPNDGLCNYFGFFIGDNMTFDLMRPHVSELENTGEMGYWGMDGFKEEERNGYDFTPLRQNVVLFMAAMNGEL